jgi:hypothetical protein
MKKRIHIRFVEFFIIGVAMGVIEDIIAIKLSTDATITFETIVIAALVALPFAAFSELVVDRPMFWKKFLRLKDPANNPHIAEK